MGTTTYAPYKIPIDRKEAQQSELGCRAQEHPTRGKRCPEIKRAGGKAVREDRHSSKKKGGKKKERPVK